MAQNVLRHGAPTWRTAKSMVSQRGVREVFIIYLKFEGTCCTEINPSMKTYKHKHIFYFIDVRAQISIHAFECKVFVKQKELE